MTASLWIPLIGVGMMASESAGRKTIIISADGFRWDYYGRYPTPGLDKLRSHGVHVKNLANTFATLTFPSHFTMATGVFEETHGIVANEMYDPSFNESFAMDTVDPKWWQGAEPVWVVAERLGKQSVCVNWVGCSIPHNGTRPSFWNNYDGTIPYHDRVDRVVHHVSEGAELGLLYFEEPDHSCHMHGPDSPEVEAAIKRVDEAIQYLLSGIDMNEVNVIFTADHGGVDVSKNMTVVLEDFTDSAFRLSSDGALAHVWPKHEADADKIHDALEKIPRDQAKCYLRDSLSPKLHYSRNQRIAPIVCIAALGWSILKSQEEKDAYVLKGSHGYLSNHEDSPMRPIFLAGGPDFVSEKRVIEPFSSVHLFPLLASLVGIPNDLLPQVNGTIDAVKHLLRPHVQESEDKQTNSWSGVPLLMGYAAGLSLVVASA